MADSHSQRPASDSTTTVATETDIERGSSWQKPTVELAAIESQGDAASAAANNNNNATTTDLEKGAASEPEGSDPNVVNWDGPDDPENPQNWPDKKKWMNIGLISGLTLVTPLGSSMFAPGIPSIMVEFKETSSIVATFVVSVYILGFAFGPLIVAPLSETYGRRHLYNWGNVFFVIFSIATALSKNMDMMLAFRFFMGLAGSVPITIGSGSIADMMPIEQRGRAMSAWALGPLLGPCVGPVAGGYLIKAAGWAWTFWLTAIVGGIFIPCSFILMKETYGPTILENRVRRLRKETGNKDLRSALTPTQPTAEKWRHAIVRPLKLLILTPIVTVMALYIAVAYGILYLMITTFSFVYRDQYGFDEGEAGLTFLPAGIGMMIGVVTFGALADMLVKRKQATGEPLTPEIRLTPALVMPCAIVLPIGLFIYGWTTNYSVHFIVPMLGVVIFCCGLMGVMMCIQNYLLDTLPRYAASVTAALAVLRSLAGALLPLGGLEMYNALGLGWGNSLLGFLTLAMVPLPLIFFLFGARIRGRSNLNIT
ncbi:polyamine transporter 3 [Plectosphaerella cucumerina]|uniref:Polyamine transporter 3 n=1 Tax=Plectosphaerella cucumerina TaxID=40658 RepID=A0A8K0THY7_9PEZI|nr:polyamine transporter 3 [Plectosphaerella cucumerina]